MDFSTGTITNILITSAGSGYLPNDTLSVQLIGGGYTNVATLGTIAWAPNVNNGGLMKSSNGTLILTGTNSYGGTTLINGGTLVFQPSAITTNVLGGLGGSGAMQHNGPGLTIFSGSGAGFTGAAAINTGVVQFANSGAVPVYQNVTINPAGTVAFDFGGNNVQAALANGIAATSAGVIALTSNSANETINFDVLGLSSAYLGALGTVNLPASFVPNGNNLRIGGGGGTLVLNNAMTVYPTVAIGNGANAGTVQINQANIFNSTADVTVGAGATLNVNGYSQSIGSLAGGGAIINTNAMTTLTVGNNGNSTVFSGVISGTQTLSKVGAGVLMLSGLNTYSGATLINSGTLQLRVPGLVQGALSGSFDIASPNPGGSVVQSLIAANTASSPPWSNNTTWVYTGYVYNNATTNVTWTFGKSIDDSTLIKIDGATVINNGTYSSIVTANYVLTPGPHTLEVRLGNATGGAGEVMQSWWTNNMAFGVGYDALGRNANTISFYVAPTDPGDGSFFSAGSATPTNSPVFIASGATLDVNGVQGAGSLNDLGGAGGAVINSSSLPAYLTLTLAAGSNATFTGNISDSGTFNALSLTKNGSGTQILGGTNIYSGGTVINTGVLQFAVAAAVSPNSNILINAGGAAAFDFTVANGLQTALGKVSGASTGLVAFTATSAGENFDFAAANLSNTYFGAVSTQAYTGVLTPFGGVYRLGALAGGLLYYSNSIASGSVAIGGGAGTVALTNTLNSYAGGTIINSGILQIGADSVLGLAPGSAATNLTFAGSGTLLSSGSSLSLAATRTIFVTNGATALFDDNGGLLTIGGALNGGGTFQKINTGTLVIATYNSIANLFIGGGALNFVGPTFLTNTTLVVGGNVLNSRAVLPITNNLNVSKLQVGGSDNINAAGAVYQSNSVVTLPSTLGLVLGDGAGSYGYYNLMGGILSNASGGSIYVGNRGVGVFDLNGGTLNPGSSIWVADGSGGTISNQAAGILNLFSGTINAAGNGTSYHTMNGTANVGSYGVINFLGGTMNATTGNGLGLMYAPGNTGIVNLDAGVLNAARVLAETAGLSIFNFNGGTLKASASQASYLQGLTAAYVFSSNAIIDTVANNITISQNLLAPTGYGVTNISLLDGGANYLGAPAVKITGGMGQGATAIAQINAVGVITNILITSAGSGYQSNDVLTVQLLGGGATASATLGTVVFAANTNSGGLIKFGTGTLALSGNNTYGGNTLVAAGNLQLGANSTSGSLLNQNVIFSNTTSWLGFGHSDVFTNSLAVSTPNGNITQLVQNGSGMLVVTNTTLNFNQAVISNGTVWFASGAVPTNMAGINSIMLAAGGGVAIGGAFNSVNSLLASGLLVTNTPVAGTLALMSGANSESIAYGAYSNLYLGAALGQTATFIGSLTSANGATSYLVGGGGGTLIVGNPNAFTDANALTNRSVVVGNGVVSVVQIVGPQSYTGGTLITNATLSINSDNNLGYGNITMQGNSTLQVTNAPNFYTIKNLTVNTSAGVNYLDLGTGSTATWFGAISSPNNANSFQKIGGGTLILSNSTMALNTPYLMRFGTVVVDNGAIITNAQYTDVGQVTGDSATLLVRGNGQLLTAADFNLGDSSTNGVGVVTVQDSASVVANQASGNTYIGKSGTGTLNVNGGTVSVANILMGNAASGIGTNNIAGGVEIIRGTMLARTNSGVAVLNLNGGILRAGNNFVVSNLTAATVNGTPFLDSSTYTVTLNQAFTGSGTLTKLGSGTLIVNAPSNTFAGLAANAGMVQFAGTSGMTAGRTLTLNAGSAAGYTNGASLDQTFLLRVSLASSGTVALTANGVSNLDFSATGANLTNVSLGAFGATAWTNSGVFTNFGNTYRLGGGGGTLVFTNNIVAGNGTNLIAFGSGSGGTLALTGTNGWSTTTVKGGVVKYGSVAALGTNVTVSSGGAVANNGALDLSLLAQINAASAGAFALVQNNAATPVNLSAFPNLSLGAANGSWTNDAAITPAGNVYQLGGGGGTLVLTNSLLNGAGMSLVAFSGSNSGGLVLTGTNTYDSGTWIGTLGTATVNNVALGTGAVTNNGSLIFSQGSTGVFANAISGGGNVAFAGVGMLTLSGANTYTGLTTVGTGFSLVLSNAAGAAVQGNVQIGTGGNAFLIMGAGNQFAPNTVVSGVGSGGSNLGRFVLNGTTQTIAGLSSVAGQGLVENTDQAQTNAAGVYTAGPALLIISNGLGAYYTFDGGYFRNYYTAGASNTLGLIKDGLGTQAIVSGSNANFSGATVVQNGTLLLSNTTVWASPITINGGQLLLASAGNTTVMNQTVTNSVTDGIGFSGGNAFSLGGLAGNGSLTLWSGTGGGVALTVGGNNASTVYSGVLSDAGPGNYFQGSLIKTGSGTLTLTATNLYNGPTTINGGQLYISSDLNLGQPNNYLSINGAALEVTNSFTLNNRAVTLTGNGGFNVDPASTLTITNVIAGFGNLVKTNAGTLLLGAANSYTGTTAVAQGTLVWGANNAVPATSAVTLGTIYNTTGNLNLGNFSDTIRSLTIAANSPNTNLITIGAGNTLTISNSVTGNAFSAGNFGSTVAGGVTQLVSFVGGGALAINAPSGNVSMEIIGTNALGGIVHVGVLDMSGLSNFTATVNNFNVATVGSAGANSLMQLTLKLATNNTITATNIFLATAGNGYTTNGVLALGQNNTLNANTIVVGGGRQVLTASFQNVSSPLLTVRGIAGGSTRANLIVSDNADYAGGSTPITDVLDLSAGTADLRLGTLMVGDGGNGVSATARAQANGIMILGGASSIVDVNTAIVGRAANFTGQGPVAKNTANGTLILSNGTFNANSAMIVAQNDQASGTYTQTVTGTFAMYGGSAVISNGVVLGQHTAASPDAGLVTATLTLAGGKLLVTGDITNGSGNTYSSLTLSGGTLDMQGHSIGSASRSVDVFSAQAGGLYNLGQLNNGTPLVKTTTGSLVLSNNTYTGGTTNLLGTLLVGGNSAFGSGLLTMSGGSLGVANGGGWSAANTMDLRAVSNVVDTTGGNLTLAGVLQNTGALVVQGANMLLLTASNTYSGGTTINGGTLQLGDGATLNGYIQGNITNNALLVVADPFDQTIGGVISGSGGLTKLAAGTLTLSAFNTYLGSTIISNGTLRLGLNDALPVTSLFVTTAGALDLNGYKQSVNSLNNFAGVITNSGAANTLTLNLNATTQTFGGTLAGPANFTVQGLGKLNVTGASSPSYTGNVNISNATVMVQGTLTGGGLISVLNGGTLGGTGALAAVQVFNGGAYNPGYVSPFSAGAQSVVSLTLTGGLFGGQLVNTSNYSRVYAANGFTLTPGTTNYLYLALDHYSGEPGDTYVLVQNNSSTPWNGNLFTLADPLSPYNNMVLSNLVTFAAVGNSGQTNFFHIAYNFNADGGAVGNDLVLTVVPEPTSLSLLLLLGAAYGLRRGLQWKRTRPPV